MTNGDKIRQMTDEELTALIKRGHTCDMCEYGKEILCATDCVKGLLIWMKKEVEQ